MYCGGKSQYETLTLSEMLKANIFPLRHVELIKALQKKEFIYHISELMAYSEVRRHFKRKLFFFLMCAQQCVTKNGKMVSE